MKFATKAIHAGQSPDPATGAVMTPIYQTSTYIQESPGVHKGYEYSRTDNPTRTPLQKQLAALENADYGLVFASGMAATDAILRDFCPGDEVICSNDLYGGTYRAFRQVFEPLGIQFHFISLAEPGTMSAYINERTRMVWVETPTNPLLNIIDIAAVAQEAKKHNLLVCVDNTFSTPYLQNPLDLGADLVVHSLTKYLAGHSDVVMGAVATNSEAWYEKLHFLQNAVGGVPGPMDCFLALRGIKTLPLRMRQHCENARQIAYYLQQHPAVGHVNYPGLESHPGHQLAARQMRDFGGMVSFLLADDDYEKAVRLMKSLKVFMLGESLGGVESICTHPASMTHAAIPKEERLKNGLSDSLIRLSVGIEDVGDLMDDLSQAIAAAEG